MIVRCLLTGLILVTVPLSAAQELEGFPADPVKAAKAALAASDYRLAGWGMADYAHPGTAPIRWSPYGLRCRDLPVSSFRYVYEKSDAIGLDAANGYRQQKSFMFIYNNALLRSGKLPKSWRCAEVLMEDR